MKMPVEPGGDDGDCNDGTIQIFTLQGLLTFEIFVRSISLAFDRCSRNVLQLMDVLATLWHNITKRGSRVLVATSHKHF